MENNRLVQLAAYVSRHAHHGQFRRDRVTPYFEHIKAVVDRVGGESEVIVAVAYLHDVIEDTKETAETLRARGFPESVVSSVVLLTKGKENYETYLAGVKVCEVATKVKVADMLSNLADDPSKKQILKYAKGLLFLLSKG